jgi:hypothetical protein
VGRHHFWWRLGLGFFLGLAVPAAAADDPIGINGGSLCFTPSYLLPAGALEKALPQAFGYNLDFDIGTSPNLSVIFGGGYYDMAVRTNRDLHLLLAPGWFGLKFKYHFLPVVEFYWETAGSLYYQRMYYVHSSVGSEENLDGGVVLGCGWDLWLSRWFVTGIEAKYHLMMEPGRIFPAVQMGLRLGIRG